MLVAVAIHLTAVSPRYSAIILHMPNQVCGQYFMAPLLLFAIRDKHKSWLGPNQLQR